MIPLPTLQDKRVVKTLPTGTKRYTSIASFSLMPEIAAALDTVCKETGLKKSYIVNRAIAMWIEANINNQNTDRLDK